MSRSVEYMSFVKEQMNTTTYHLWKTIGNLTNFESYKDIDQTSNSMSMDLKKSSSTEQDGL